MLPSGHPTTLLLPKMQVINRRSFGFVTDAAGNRTSVSTPVSVIPVARPTVIVTPTPQSAPGGSTISISINITAPNGIQIQNVHVDFTNGLLTQWYPQTALSSPWLLHGDASPPLKGGYLQWFSLVLKPGGQTNPIVDFMVGCRGFSFASCVQQGNVDTIYLLCRL